MQNNLRPEAAEAVGAFLLVLVGCGAIAAQAGTATFGPLGVALAFTFVLAVLVYGLGPLSGAHFNPAVTIGLAVARRFPWNRVPSYLAAQFAGAILAAFTLRAVLGSDANLGVTRLEPSITTGTGFLIEALGTFVLAFTIIAVATNPRVPAAATGLSIGLALGSAALFAGPWTGGSFNPARSLGPALAAGDLTGISLYLTAPIAGAALAVLAYEAIRGAVPPQPRRSPTTAAATLAPTEDA
jgi:MIP family channel proteins